MIGLLTGSTRTPSPLRGAVDGLGAWRSLPNFIRAVSSRTRGDGC